MRFLMPAVFVLSAFLTMVVSIAHSDAGGRIGSHRVGGYTSHGKGSHYIGGH